ncbi:MAG TPA: ABC transporter permease [Sulfolobales archaeon]|nr:ABC transporter permease [Sulfolobales archaeon]
MSNNKRSWAVRSGRRFLRVLRDLYRSNTRLTASIAMVLIIVALGILAPLITWYPPLKTLVGQPFSPPNLRHLFGTDDLGRDIYTDTMYGIRTTLLVGLLSALIALVIGIVIGAIAGYRGGTLGEILMRITDMAFIVPSFLLALLIAMILGPSIQNILLAIGVTSWPGIARIMRAEVLRVKEQPFVEVAKVLGLSDQRIIFVHIMPNAISTVIPYIALQTGSNILVEAGLGFLGVSDPNVPSLGRLLNIAQQYLTSAWWMAVFPGSFLAIIIIAFNMLGDGLIDYINPRIREQQRELRSV